MAITTSGCLSFSWLLTAVLTHLISLFILKNLFLHSVITDCREMSLLFGLLIIWNIRGEWSVNWLVLSHLCDEKLKRIFNVLKQKEIFKWKATLSCVEVWGQGPLFGEGTSVEWCGAVDVAGHKRGLGLLSDRVIPHSADAALRRQTTRQNMSEHSLWERQQKYFPSSVHSTANSIKAYLWSRTVSFLT